ncbi:hypothetical protein BALOs_2822 [Halobacteriovorax sp. BALOs_7]|uniref:PorV/PorQ family protein n=1 Tax=Halobacteriovorax vibrionivorans TaxID=2152716 RepID=A0ABY0IIR6_9BACT|nr:MULTISPECIES: hypothetical protein [Halobacteriovorax]AYF45811.1 hypothetical protein BALOs_2822 [Halobacteriovorax sp. BALOs_7]RZF22851.1 hypothetical protein DAY19_03500 [Halobacteriovorax vibrionivorans]TGD47356.1 hypothetical protein EP118_08550 [Halobacteriovorax sp. Y22]
MKKLILLLLLIHSSIYAIQFEDAVFPEIVTSSRALAMGNAFIAKVDDASAAFYNPAGLGTYRGKHFHLSNFQFETNKGWMETLFGGDVTGNAGDIFDALSLEGARKLLNQNKGTVSHSRFQMMPNFSTRYFSMGYVYAVQQRAFIGDQAGDQFEYAQRTDHGPYAAFNFSLFGGIVKIGATATYLFRKEAIGTADPAVALDLPDTAYNQGKMLFFTTGFRLTLPYTFLPTLAITSHNTGGTSFEQTGGPAAPADIKQTFDLGLSLTPQIGRTMRVHMELNYKDALGEHSNVDTIRKLGLGLEFDLRRIFYFRLGYGDGFGSGGIGIRTRKMEFDLSTYAVDTTDSDFRGQVDRRYVLGISSGF